MNELSIKLSLLISLLLPSCVSPPDYEDGLLENIPAVINDVDYFSLSILADDYSDNLKWDLDIWTFVCLWLTKLTLVCIQT